MAMRRRATKKKPKSLYEVLTAAVNYYVDNGWDNEKSLLSWCAKLRIAANRETVNSETTRNHLTAIYKRLVIDGGAIRDQPFGGPTKVTLAKVRPDLRKELERRIFVSANLIKLNREAAIEKTIQRFQGWVSSVPVGGTNAVDRVEQKAQIRAKLSEQTFEHRRVAIDQGHKLAANITDIIAIQGGAIAVKWHSPWRRPGYNYREDHKERDEKIYLLRDSWAIKQGLIKPVNGYYDEITAVGEEVYCSCQAIYIYAPQKLPDEFLTEKGKREFERA
ncbi:hypothetical protein [Serratia fonticola]